MSVELRDDNFYETEDSEVTISVDFEDASEREATIWYQAENEEEKQKLFEKHEDFIRAVFALYDTDLDDGTVDSTEEDIEGGMQDLLMFTPTEIDEPYYEDGEEVDEDEYR